MCIHVYTHIILFVQQIAVYDNNGRKFTGNNNVVIVTQMSVTKDSGITETHKNVSYVTYFHLSASNVL